MSDLFDIYEERERIKRLEHRHGECSISIEEREVDTAKEYYLLPRYEIAIPACPASQRLLVETLTSKGDYTSSQKLCAYPCISEAHILLHFPNYTRLAYSATITVTKPIFKGDIARLDRLTRERKKRMQKNASSHAKLLREQQKEIF